MPKAYVLKIGRDGKPLPVLALPVELAADGSVVLPTGINPNQAWLDIAAASGKLDGVAGSTLVMPSTNKKYSFVVLYGASVKPGEAWRDWIGPNWALQAALGKVVETVRGLNYEGDVRPDLEIVLPRGCTEPNDVRLATESIELANARHELPDFANEKRALLSCTLVFPNSDRKSCIKAVHEGRVVSGWVNWARRLGTETSNRLTPLALIEKIVKGMEPKTLPDYNISIANRWNGLQELRDAGYNLAAAVGQGSAFEPHGIVLEYHGGGRKAPFVDLIGKGVTYDSGGLYMKPAPGANDMHQDMVGAAVAAATFFAAAELGVRLNLRLRVIAVENMVDSTAYRNGDVIRCGITGLSVRIGHSDAEGRLVLLPQIGAAVRDDGKHVITVATLTGAAVRAFANGTCFWVRGLHANDAKQTARSIYDIADEACERVWQQPWDPAALKALKDGAEGADVLNNVNGRDAGGHQLAAEFLGLGLGKDYDGRFLHYDIAQGHKNAKTDGMAYQGGEAPMVRTLVRYLEWLAII